MKRYDLMQDINTRGTFVVSKACVPHLKRSENPHVLTMSPPLSLDPKWLSDHVGYTIAKYGMSLCTLGMAEEFRADGIAFNSLWPRTIIATAAVQNLLGGDEAMARSRRPELMADAAHAIVTRSSPRATGNLFLAEDVLAEEGVDGPQRLLLRRRRGGAPDGPVRRVTLVARKAADGNRPTLRWGKPAGPMEEGFWTTDSPTKRRLAARTSGATAPGIAYLVSRFPVTTEPSSCASSMRSPHARGRRPPLFPLSRAPRRPARGGAALVAARRRSSPMRALRGLAWCFGAASAPHPPSARVGRRRLLSAPVARPGADRVRRRVRSCTGDLGVGGPRSRALRHLSGARRVALPPVAGHSVIRSRCTRTTSTCISSACAGGSTRRTSSSPSPTTIAG